MLRGGANEIQYNAVLYPNKTGYQWALLPYDLPSYKTVSPFYHRAKDQGLGKVFYYISWL